MSKEISLEEVKKFWPQSAPNINNIKKYVKKYKNEKIVIKYGGNVLIDRNIFDNFIEDINILNKLGLSIVVVHGGGPRIKRELDKSNIQTKFIRGLRVTDKNIIKIISSEPKNKISDIKYVYSKILKDKLYQAESIEIAEFAKVFENTQRDLNISLMNELSLICNKMNINTKNVISAAATKWNFIKFNPGLVGGHCISVDPYYLSYKAKRLGYKTKLINAGRNVNNKMPKSTQKILFLLISISPNHFYLFLFPIY